MKAYTRTHSKGRIPNLRDTILEYLEDQNEPKTAKDIADNLGLNKSSPYRPLQELVKLKILDVSYGIDGTQYTVDRQFLEYFKMHPRRVK